VGLGTVACWSAKNLASSVHGPVCLRPTKNLTITNDIDLSVDVLPNTIGVIVAPTEVLNDLRAGIEVNTLKSIVPSQPGTSWPGFALRLVS